MSSVAATWGVTEERERALPRWFLPAYSGLVIAVYFLLALGSSVRVMKAGLACPDWPLCFGDVIPDYHPQVYFEFIHRVVAGLVAVSTVSLHFVLMRSAVARWLKVLAGFALVLLLTQIVFGALTVVLLLKSGVVATHLLLGASFFVSLLWIYLSLKGSAFLSLSTAHQRRLFAQSVFVTAAVFGQILLGGMVAANFASLVCIDFPTCHGEWFPTFSGIIGLHIIHRLGGYFVFVTALVNGLLAWRFGSPRFKKLAGILFACVCGQICLGIANVLFLTPPLIAVAHLAMAMAILSVAVRQVHLVSGAARPAPLLKHTFGSGARFREHRTNPNSDRARPGF